MTITNLWNACGNWTPFCNVRIYSIVTGITSNYSYFEDVLRDWADSLVLSFDYSADTDTMNINVK